jgi:CheY-like chemotaxis protein
MAVAAAAKPGDLELLMDVSGRVPRFIRSDSGKLRQVLTNLVGNALKYTDQGTVTVRLDARPEGGSASLVLIFEVEDTGIGIAPEDQPRIFDPFVQAGGPRTSKGAGLGLSITRQFVQLLGGSIQMESAPGRGSRFHIEVPVEPAEASEVAPEIVTTEQVLGLAPGQPDYRILIVEDRRENWLLLQRLLQTAGFQARVAEDGAQAVESLKIWRPHFIWMDVRLPVMNGREAARRIRDLEGGREVKIVAVTASAFASQREEVLAADFDDFLRKPYRPREIFDCMARHLGVRYMYRAGPQATAGNQPTTLRPQDFAALPAVLRDELEKAVVALDRTWIVRVIGQISEQNGPLGSVLARLADRLAYTSIYEALEGCKGEFRGAGI